MSLFGSIQMAGNTLQAMQIGLHVVGNNIANANTPGYIRERTIFTPAPVQKLGNLTLGLGVEVAGIVQNIDKFVEERLRGVGGDRASAEIQEKVYRDLESILGELSRHRRQHVAHQLLQQHRRSRRAARGNVGPQPGRPGRQDAGDDDQHAQPPRRHGVRGFRPARSNNLTTEINTLTEQIRKLNVQIVALEGGNADRQPRPAACAASGSVALKRLAEIADIKVNENAVGAVNVSVGGELLVFEGTRREVKTELRHERRPANRDRSSSPTTAARCKSPAASCTASTKPATGSSADSSTGSTSSPAALAFEFNKVYSQGQGVTGFTSVTSQERSSDADAALDAAGLAVHAGQRHVRPAGLQHDDKLTETHTISVDLDGLDDDTTLASLAAAARRASTASPPRSRPTIG